MIEYIAEINVKVPQKYKKKKYLKAFSMGLYDLLFEEKEVLEDLDHGDMNDLVSVRIKLSSKGLEYWNYLLSNTYDGNRRKLAREALYLISQEPEHCLACRI